MRDPDTLIELAQKIQRPLERYLKWKQVCDRYERGLKVIFAECFLSVQIKADATIKEREMYAYATQKYLNYLAEMDGAEKEKVKAQVQYDTLKTSIEALTSALAFDRETIKRGM